MRSKEEQKAIDELNRAFMEIAEHRKQRKKAIKRDNYLTLATILIFCIAVYLLSTTGSN